MPVSPFSITRLPKIEFGSGVFAKTATITARLGRRLLLVTGAYSFRHSPQWETLHNGLDELGVSTEHLTIRHEPSPTLVDTAVAEFSGSGIEVVIGVGGGSVLDAAKAIAGMLPHGNSVMDHLEGVGPELPYKGPALPFVAIPTTAGTGSEATRNAVLSATGPNGFKKSFRDESLVPRYAIVDPDLLRGCPRELIAANGLDAITQLIESVVSLNANPFTDALALDALRDVRRGLFDWFNGTRSEAQGRQAMAYAALISGITLAQTGLGSVHGLASPLGAFFPIPHGVACGTLLAAATRMNIRAMNQRQPDHPALIKYAAVSSALSGHKFSSLKIATQALQDTLDEWRERLKLPLLRKYQVRSADFGRIIANCRGSSMKTNPIELSDSEIEEILYSCL